MPVAINSRHSRHFNWAIVVSNYTPNFTKNCLMDIIIKTAEQIDGIRKSSRLAGETLLYIEPFIEEGVTTDYLDRLIHQFMVERGAIPATLDYNGFPKSCCISLNEVVCHGIPSAKITLKKGDILNVDVTTILDGYFGDTSKMYTCLLYTSD